MTRLRDVVCCSLTLRSQLDSHDSGHRVIVSSVSAQREHLKEMPVGERSEFRAHFSHFLLLFHANTLTVCPEQEFGETGCLLTVTLLSRSFTRVRHVAKS